MGICRALLRTRRPPGHDEARWRPGRVKGVAELRDDAREVLATRAQAERVDREARAATNVESVTWCPRPSASRAMRLPTLPVAPKTTMCIVFLRFRFLLWPTVVADCTAKQFRCVPR
jgi:hypothetical protein